MVHAWHERCGLDFPERILLGTPFSFEENDSPRWEDISRRCRRALGEAMNELHRTILGIHLV